MRKFSYIFILFFLFLGSTCLYSVERLPQRVFKDDTNYFLALRLVEGGNLKEAERLFTISSKKGTRYVARKSYEELIRISNVRDRASLCEKYIQAYNDNDAILASCREMSEEEEYSKVVSFSNGLDVRKTDDAIMYYRLDALKHKRDTKYKKELYDWFTQKPLSSEHIKFYKDNGDDFKIDNQEVASNIPIFPGYKVPSNYKSIMNFRIDVYKRNYGLAYARYKESLSSNENFEYLPLVVCDIGKACLYGGDVFYRNARFLDNLCPNLTSNEAKYYAYFYSGRLYEKSGDYYTLSSNRYKSAMEAAPNDRNYDSALWYLLNLNLKFSTNKGINAVKQYCSQWHDPDFFDDLLEILAPLLLSEGKWSSFHDIYKAIDGYASNEMTARYAYIYARLIQEKIIGPSGKQGEDEAQLAFTRALNSGSDMYYRVMAIKKLGLGEEKAELALCNQNVRSNLKIDNDAETLLMGYASFGFPEKIFKEYMKFINNDICVSFDCAMKLSSFLNECGEVKNEYFPQSLRIASKAMSRNTRPITKDDLKLYFPKDYSKLVSLHCTQYDVPEEIMYALIRSESYFDSQVKSSAGAVGLTQLMKLTASDIARKLKTDKYSLKDANLNIKFGTYYISDINKRLNGHWLNSFFAYNAGIGRVRKWLNGSKIALDKTNLPSDIILEMIPYQETRGYGRKLVSAASMYGWLYYGKTVAQVVDELVK